MKTLFDYCKPSLKDQARALVERGYTKKATADRFNLPYDQVVRWTLDIKRRSVYPPEVKQEARRRVLEGQDKVTIAQDMGIKYTTIVAWTKDLTRREIPALRGPVLKVLQDITQKGYVFPSDNLVEKSYKELKKYMPLRHTRVRNLSIYYLEDKREIAFRAFVEKYGKKVINYRVLSMARKAFGIKDAWSIIQDVEGDNNGEEVEDILHT